MEAKSHATLAQDVARLPMEAATMQQQPPNTQTN